MMFLLRVGFWLSLVVLLLPFGKDRVGSESQGISAFQAMSAAGAAVSDMSQFCSRQPDACVTGAQAAVVLGEKAQAAAGAMLDFLSKRNAGEPTGSTTVSASERSEPAMQNTLTPADRQLPWRGAPSRTRHPA